MESNTHRQHAMRDLSGTALCMRYTQLIPLIHEQAERHGWRVSTSLELPSNAAEPISALSRNARKRLHHALHRAALKPSLHTVSRLLHRIFGSLPDALAPKVSMSAREERIREARKAWRKARLEAEVLRLAYVQEKGDFFLTPQRQ